MNALNRGLSNPTFCQVTMTYTALFFFNSIKSTLNGFYPLYLITSSHHHPHSTPNQVWPSSGSSVWADHSLIFYSFSLSSLVVVFGDWYEGRKYIRRGDLNYIDPLLVWFFSACGIHNGGGSPCRSGPTVPVVAFSLTLVFSVTMDPSVRNCHVFRQQKIMSWTPSSKGPQCMLLFHLIWVFYLFVCFPQEAPEAAEFLLQWNVLHLFPRNPMQSSYSAFWVRLL